MADVDINRLEQKLANLESRLGVAEKFNQINLTNIAALAAVVFHQNGGKMPDQAVLSAALAEYFEGPNANQEKLIASAVATLAEIADL